MREKIIKKLQEIEEEQKVKILYAVESGSRAWGFESKDSDYDVRFIYAHLLDWYISIDEKRDVIEYPLQDALDIIGWDIKKALQLYKKSNPPLYEWLVSPIIYRENGNFAQQLRELTSQFYSPLTTMHHYLHMAEGNYREYLQGDTVRIKKYFYVLRPVFACIWIEQYKTQPPVEFKKMLHLLEIDLNLKEEIEKLYIRKKSGEELDKEKRIVIINNFLNEKIGYFEKYIKEIKIGQKQKNNTSILDILLRNSLVNSK